jgi:hypothetical protein
VTTQGVDALTGKLTSSGDQAAFKRDAAMCFTQAQLDKLFQSYAFGDRKYDPATDRGEWQVGPAHLQGEDTMVRY